MPARLRAIEDQLISSGLLHFLQHHDAPLATFEQLARVHAPHYIETVRSASPSEGLVYLDPDTAMNPIRSTPHCAPPARRCWRPIWCWSARWRMPSAPSARPATMPNPPCHGLLLFNNVAVGVAHAIERHGLTRVAIADFDVHHGNGTRKSSTTIRASCCAPPSSIHSTRIAAPAAQRPHHQRAVAGGTDGAAFRQAVSERWLPALERFRPEMLFISAGFDAHWEDDMASFRLKEPDYAWVTQQLKDVAHKHAQERIVSVRRAVTNCTPWGEAWRHISRC